MKSPRNPARHHTINVVWHAEKSHKERFRMKDKSDSKSLNVICCFCGNSLKFNLAVELIIKPNPDSDELQTLYCHKNCLSGLIIESIPLHPDIKS